MASRLAFRPADENGRNAWTAMARLPARPMPPDAFIVVQTDARRLIQAERIRPPSSGSTGSRLNRPTVMLTRTNQSVHSSAHQPARRKKKAKPIISRFCNGPARATAVSWTESAPSAGSATATPPKGRSRTSLTRQPNQRAAATWPSSWTTTTPNRTRSSTKCPIRRAAAIISTNRGCSRYTVPNSSIKRNHVPRIDKPAVLPDGEIQAPGPPVRRIGDGADDVPGIQPVMFPHPDAFQPAVHRFHARPVAHRHGEPGVGRLFDPDDEAVRGGQHPRAGRRGQMDARGPGRTRPHDPPRDRRHIGGLRVRPAAAESRHERRPVADVPAVPPGRQIEPERFGERAANRLLQRIQRRRVRPEQSPCGAVKRQAEQPFRRVLPQGRRLHPCLPGRIPRRLPVRAPVPEVFRRPGAFHQPANPLLPPPFDVVPHPASPPRLARPGLFTPFICRSPSG